MKGLRFPEPLCASAAASLEKHSFDETIVERHLSGE
jgi:hypothetical protein